MKDSKSFLGRGWSFPPTFSKQSNRVEMVEADDDIKQSLKILLSTTIGERIFRPDYGADLNSIMFKRLNEETKNKLVELVSEAIFKSEPRVKVEGIAIGFFESVARIHIDYIVKDVNIRTNIVYPFYLVEGTEVGEV